MKFNCCRCEKGPANLDVHRQVRNTFLFTGISCDIQSTCPIVASVGERLIDCISALPLLA